MDIHSSSQQLQSDSKNAQLQDGAQSTQFTDYLQITRRLQATCTAFSPDNRLIAIGYSIKSCAAMKIELWELDSDGGFTKTWDRPGLGDAVASLQFSPDG